MNIVLNNVENNDRLSVFTNRLRPLIGNFVLLANFMKMTDQYCYTELKAINKKKIVIVVSVLFLQNKLSSLINLVLIKRNIFPFIFIKFDLLNKYSVSINCFIE